MEELHAIKKEFEYDLTSITNDENQNDVLVRNNKKEQDETDDYHTNLESILNYTKQFQQDENYIIKSEVKEELEFETYNAKDESANQADCVTVDSENEEIDVINYNNFDDSAFQISKILQSEVPKVKVDYSCMYCSFKSSELTVLKTHLTEHKEEPLKIRKTYINSKAVLKPKKKTLKDKTLKEKKLQKITKTCYRKCSYCDYKAKDKIDWNDHRTRQHSKSMNRKCQFCEFITNSASHLKTHMNRHTNELMFKCQYCTYETVLSGHLKRHINSVHIKSTQYPCRYCDLVTVDFGTLKRHIEKKHDKVVISGKINAKNEPKVGQLIDVRKKDNNDSKDSSRRLRTKNQEKFQCQYCEYTTPFGDYLNIHINSRHLQNIWFNCQYCDYKATKAYTLRCHVNSKHTKKVLYKCEHCNLETTRSNILKRHIQRIHVLKSFKCEYCAYVAKKEGHIRNHLKRKHGMKNIKEEIGDAVKIEPGSMEIENVKFLPEIVKCESYSDGSS